MRPAPCTSKQATGTNYTHIMELAGLYRVLGPMVEDDAEKEGCQTEGRVEQGFVASEENQQPTSTCVHEPRAVKGEQEGEHIVEIHGHQVELAVVHA